MSDNKNTLDAIYREYEPYIRRVCSYKLKSMPDKVDDCVQDTFTALVEALEKGQTIKNPKNWLTIVVNNIIKGIYAEHEKEKNRLVELDSENIRENEDLYFIDNQLFAISDAQLLQYKDEIIGQLDEDEQALIFDRYRFHKSIKVMAAERHTNTNNIYQMFSRLKKKTAKLIEKFLEKQE